MQLYVLCVVIGFARSCLGECSVSFLHPLCLIQATVSLELFKTIVHYTALF